MLKVGLIGLGTVSIVHTRVIRNSKTAHLTAICDSDITRQVDAEGANFYTDVDTMLSKEDLDIVHICLPHYLHDTVARQCLEAGVHVFLEKPVTVTYQRSRTLLKDIEAMDQAPKLGICFQNRYNLTTQDLRRILQEEQSEIISVRGVVPWFRPVEYYTNKPWRGTIAEAGAGTLINQAIHTLDLMHYVQDTQWHKCKALVGNLLDYPIEVEDSAMARFIFDNGANGLFFSTNANYDNDSVELQVVTEKSRYLIKDDKLFDQDFNLLCENKSLLNTKIYYGASHADAIESFYRAVIDGTDDYVTLADALQTMEMVDVIKQSSEEGRTISREEFIHD